MIINICISKIYKFWIKFEWLIYQIQHLLMNRLFINFLSFFLSLILVVIILMIWFWVSFKRSNEIRISIMKWEILRCLYFRFRFRLIFIITIIYLGIVFFPFMNKFTGKNFWKKTYIPEFDGNYISNAELFFIFIAPRTIHAVNPTKQ